MKIPVALVVSALLGAGLCPGAAFSETGDFVAVQDATIVSLSSGPTCSSTAGSSPQGKIGREVNTGKGSSVSVSRFLLRFDLSAIPAGSTVHSATLELYFNSQTASLPLDIARLTNAVWDESRVFWDAYLCDDDGPSQGELAGLWCNVGGDFTMAQSPPSWIPPDVGPQSIDVTALAQKAVGLGSVTDTGSQLHLLLKAANEGTAGVYVVATSENGTVSRRPSLNVVWTPLEPQPSSPWVSFVDETAWRLQGPAMGPEGQICDDDGPWLNCDHEEKDISTGDFDDDGDQDIVIVRKRPFSHAGPRAPIVLLNQDGILVDVSSQKFVDSVGNPVSASHDSRDVFVGDFDRPSPPARSFADLVIANTCEEDPVFYRNQGGRCGHWIGLRKRPDWVPSLSTVGRRFCGVWGGDVNNDGALDVFLSNYSIECDGGEDPNLSDVLLINRLGLPQAPGFSDESAARLGVPQSPTSLANVRFGSAVEMHDLDGGGAEIMKTCTLFCELTEPWNDNDVFILRNDGTGDFRSLTDPRIHKLDVFRPYMFAGGDLNGDGLIDFFEVDDFDDQVRLADGDPFTFVPGMVDNRRLSGHGGNAKLGDLDDDGDLDVGVSGVDVDVDGCPDREFALLRNDGLGNFDDPYIASKEFHLSAFDVAFVDINGDRCLDLFVGRCGDYKVWINTKRDCG